MNSSPELSIIVVNFNSSAFILKCLATLKEAFAGKTHEVIVIDNHSWDESCWLIREKYPHLLLIENDKNLGYARAVNQGFRKAKGKYLLILNPDVQLLSGSIDKMTYFLEGNPEVGLLLPKLINPDGSLQLSCRTFYDFSTFLFRRTPLGKIFPNHTIIRRHLMMDWDHGEVREVDWGLGACMFLRREALKGERIFDERFFLYFEDVDLCLRMKQEGWKVVYYPEAVMVHTHVRQSADGLFNYAKWEHFKSLIKFYCKHRGFRPRIS
ncbi:MAG: glycosyltransferase family 2 protein [Deltaproteobacteria bacterium]|nr:glycosyltransferase family 2 protein [Deltaproteobacteria bacterium]